MARALLGHIGTQQDQLLALEVARLRRRVRELEDEVASLRPSTETAELDLELHRIAEVAEPVLA
ncbi:MAG TPA: hypothetical protein VFU35_08565 [Jatrophihabitans sp.]|nr:hypothetical protein [Jatrophihabitans sp.]